MDHGASWTSAAPAKTRLLTAPWFISATNDLKTWLLVLIQLVVDKSLRREIKKSVFAVKVIF